jgi:hypothetical protein
MNDFESNLKRTVFVVTANSYEVLELWKDFKDEFGFEQEPMGYSERVGTCARMPVVIYCRWMRLNGLLIMFIEATSQVVDWRLIDKWLDKNCNPKWDQGSRIARTDAMNFGHVLQHVRALTDHKEVACG